MVRIPFKAVAVRYGRDAKRAEKLAEDLGLDVKFIDKVQHDSILVKKLDETYIKLADL